MSQHKSLQGASGIVRKRNVLKRFERVEILKKRGQWKETAFKVFVKLNLAFKLGQFNSSVQSF